jgi:alkanesulfonate monooxygenase SsuD/methylene tetrahydromethanopterin reductase-like flavin-dependent oxidoreductase (luciferase family)
MAVGLAEQVQFVRQARDCGWDSLWTGQHFLTESTSQLSTIVTLTRLTVEAGDMQIGIGLLLLPLLNPVEVAEQVASLDVVSGGRLILGVGIGYRESEYNAFAVPKAEAVSRFSENLQIVRGLLVGERVDADLPWCSLRGAELSVGPSQKNVPLWMGANADAAVRRAARMADAWLINPHAPISTIRRQMLLWAEARSKAGLPPSTAVPLIREIVCATRSEDAHALAEQYLGPKYRTYAEWGQDQVLPDNDTFDGPFSDLANQRFIVGDPEECLRSLLAWRETIGVNHFVFRLHWSGMPIDAAAKSLELLSREVLPELRGSAHQKEARPSDPSQGG